MNIRPPIAHLRNQTTLPLIVFLAMTCGLTNVREARAVSPERPNILLIVADDLGYADVGFNWATDIKTPALDQLAENGVGFSSAYFAHPVCGPSRAAIMTGRYPHRYGAQDNLPPYRTALGIPVDEPFISEVLQTAGYSTATIGKWHLGEGEPFQPYKRGFDDFYGFLRSGHAYFPNRYRAKLKRERDSGKSPEQIPPNLDPLERNGKQVHETQYQTDAFSREAVSLIQRSSETQQPFFIYLAYNAPHAPIEAKQEDKEQFPNIEDKTRRTYAGMVYAIDRGIKQFVDSLKATGQYENTLIIFLSDNGGKTKVANNAPLRGGKRNASEGGYRVPMFFHWPDQVSQGKRFEYPVLALYFFPTLARIATATIPAGTAERQRHLGRRVGGPQSACR